tara:strand:+ start:717 stop:1814 length:1098 start_codon:yes stop_codon:yes gene_type:complete
MRRNASEVINELETRVARLEKQAKITIASEEKLLERHIKSTRGVLDVSVDLSKRDRITMDIDFHGTVFHFVGECEADWERIYAGSKTANPGALGAFFMMNALRPRRRRRSRGVGHIGNRYKFTHPHPFPRSRWDVPTIYVYTESGGIYANFGTKDIYETLKNLFNDTMKKKQWDEREEELRIERKRSEEAHAHGERIRLERAERKRKKTEMYEANRARNEERRRNRGLEKQSRTLDLLRSYKDRANEIVNTVNRLVDPSLATLSEPSKSNKRSRQAKAVFEGYDLLGDSYDYKIVFLSDDKFHSPFEKGLGNMFTQSSFTFYLNKKAIATAKNGEMDRVFIKKVREALEDVVDSSRGGDFTGRWT